MKDITNKQLAEKIDSLSKISATKADLDKFATKADLNRFATKADLDKFATKADLNRFATKADLDKFATKTDLDKLADSTKAGFDDHDKRFDATDKKLNRLIVGQEEIISKLSNVAYRFELIELQKRVNVLEKKVGIAK